MPGALLYFAYGSNLKRSRMEARVQGAAPAGIGVLEGYRLACNKRGRDGSAKANLVRAASARVWGAVYALPPDGFARLDPFEGGYERIAVQVVQERLVVDAHTYRSGLLHDDEIPFASYRTLMLEGAREHGLPLDFVREIEALRARPDPVPTGD